VSHRPIEEKRKRRLLKGLRNTPPAFVDLRQWIRLRVNCSNRMAERILLAEGLKVDSHPVGYKWEKDPLQRAGKMIKVLDPFLPVEYRDRIVIAKVKVD
jgi:hypothetical protein